MRSPQPGADNRHDTAGSERTWLRPRPRPLEQSTIEAWREEADRKHVEASLEVEASTAVARPQPLAPGISVVIASYRGRDHIDRCLSSLARQTLDPQLYELIVVLNGPPDGTRDILDQFRKSHDSVILRVIDLNAAGVSRARNAGIAAACRTYTTFVDDADYVSPPFLEVLLAIAEPRVVPIAGLFDVGPHGEDSTNDINRMLLEHAGKVTAPVGIPVATTFNAAKAVETALIKDIPYDVSLASGGDVVFWMTVVARGHVAFYPCPPSAGATYYRVVREDSISRPTMTFDFAVKQRLDVILTLERLADEADLTTQDVLDESIGGHAEVINTYLREHPGDHGRGVELLDRYPIFRLPYERVNARLGRSLAIAYAFPPFADTSAVVAAKRIRERGDVVDVVYNAMDTIRERDGSIRRISGPFVEQEAPLSTPSYFSHWGSMERFAIEGLKVIKRWEAAKGKYERVYSRAQFAASHFLAAAYKLSNPAASWTAEFSDPLSRDVHDQERGTAVTKSRFVKDLRTGMARLGLPLPDSANCMVWCEEITYALADELVFTNDNQMEYMIGYCSNPEVAALARKKAAISPHPTLSRDFYSMVKCPYPLDEGVAHFGYFGNFYTTRGLDDVLAAIASLDKPTQARMRLHVFTAKPAELQRRVADLGIPESVRVGPYLRYLEFLNLSTKFDCLIVNDAVTGGSHAGNPYLPSKWADYRGGGTPVWGLVEQGSPLSQQPLSVASPLGDVPAAAEVLRSVVRTKYESLR